MNQALTAPPPVKLSRKTNETDIELTLNIRGLGSADVSTGIGFLDHLLGTLARHARWDLKLSCQGDLHIDDHHTAEDCALTLGQALDQALAERRSLARFGTSYAPLDEALVRTVVDLSARPFSSVQLAFCKERIGTLSSENVTHFLQSFATASRSTIHIDMIRGVNSHHIAEAAFKSLALALKMALQIVPFEDVPSLKGSLT